MEMSISFMIIIIAMAIAATPAAAACRIRIDILRSVMKVPLDWLLKKSISAMTRAMMMITRWLLRITRRNAEPLSVSRVRTVSAVMLPPQSTPPPDCACPARRRTRG